MFIYQLRLYFICLLEQKDIPISENGKLSDQRRALFFLKGASDNLKEKYFSLSLGKQKKVLFLIVLFAQLQKGQIGRQAEQNPFFFFC